MQNTDYIYMLPGDFTHLVKMGEYFIENTSSVMMSLKYKEDLLKEVEELNEGFGVKSLFNDEKIKLNWNTGMSFILAFKYTDEERSLKSYRKDIYQRLLNLNPKLKKLINNKNVQAEKRAYKLKSYELLKNYLNKEVFLKLSPQTSPFMKVVLTGRSKDREFVYIKACFNGEEVRSIAHVGSIKIPKEGEIISVTKPTGFNSDETLEVGL